MTTVYSWIEQHEDWWGVRCDLCPGGWWTDIAGSVITFGDEIMAEAGRDRHDRLEHLVRGRG